MSAEIYARSNYLVRPGDVLLLSGKELDAGINKLFQSLKRRRTARFTHVAIVLNQDMIVDAMPDLNVTFRRWANIEKDYDIEKCRVARNTRIATDPDAAVALQKHATFLWQQPWQLGAVFTRDDSIKDQGGLVCSQFVCAVFERMHESVSTRPLMQTLPIDIDEATQKSPWRQFPMSGYALYSKCPQETLEAEVREAMSDEIQSRLTPEEQAEAKRLADQWLAETAGPGSPGFPGHVDAALAEAAGLQDNMNKLMVKATQDQYETSRLIDEFYSTLLRLSDTLIDQPHVLDQTLRAALAKSLASEDKVWLTGAQLLDSWRELFMTPPTGIFLHETSADGTYAKRRLFFLRTVELSNKMARIHAGNVRELRAELPKLRELTTNGQLTRAFVQSLLRRVDVAQLTGESLEAESQEEIRARVEEYPNIAQALATRLQDEPDDTRREQAVESLMMLWELDLERDSWATMRPVLSKLVDQLRLAL